MAAALGLGLRTGDVAISLGTSGTVYAVSETPTADATGAVAGFADATGRFLPLVCTLNATKVTETVARLLGVELGALDALALEAVPGAGGLVLVPYLDGERTPNRPDATGTLTGLRTKATRASSSRAPRSRASCADCSTGSTRSQRRAARSGRRTAGCSWSVAARGRMPTAASSRTSRADP